MQDIDRLREVILNTYNESECFRMMKLEMIELEENHAIGRIPFDSNFLNPYGTMHGGFLYWLADTVSGALAAMGGSYCTTADGTMNYFEPVKDTQYVYCEATLIRYGKHLVNIHFEIRDDNKKLLDNGNYNYFKVAKILE